MASLIPSPKMQFFDANGNPLAGGKLYTYTAGGTTTPQATYTDATGGTQNANPVVMNARGEANVWLGNNLYYMELKDASDVLIWTADNVGGSATLSALSASSGALIIGFIQSGIGAVATTVQAKLRQYVSLFDFMTAAQIADVQAGTLTQDVTAAVQAALDSRRPLYVPPGKYKITSTINIPYDAVMRGDWRFGGSTSFGGSGLIPIFVISAGVVGFQTSAANGALAEPLATKFEGITFSGGTTQLYVQNGGVGLTLRDVLFSAASSHGLHAKGYIQEWLFDDVEFAACNFLIDGTAGTGGTPSQLDKSDFRNVYVHGATGNGIDVQATLSTSVTFSMPRCVQNTGSGMRLSGGLAYWTINGLNTEGNGYLGGATPTPTTTGTITGGTNSLVVASATGYSIGGNITVQGASNNGADLITTITNIAGTTFTLADNAVTSVTNAECTPYTVDDVLIETVGGTPSAILFTECSFGYPISVGGMRYGLYSNGGAGHMFLNCTAGPRPLYSRLPTINVINLQGTYRGSNVNFEGFTAMMIGNALADRMSMGSPRGKNIVFGFVDSNGNATGTYGALEMRKFDANRTRLFYLDGTDGFLNVKNKLSPGSFGAGTGAANTFGETSAAIAFGNAAPTAGTWAKGSMVINEAATVGQPKGWRCTVAGTPGTWVSEGNL